MLPTGDTGVPFCGMSASISISLPSGRICSAGGGVCGFGAAAFGLLRLPEPEVHASEVRLPLILPFPVPQVRQFSVPVRAFNMAFMRLSDTVLPLACAHALMLLRKAAVFRFFLL